MSKPVALIIDDEPDICELLGITLSRMDISSRAVNDVASGIRELEKRDFDVCLTDMRLPDGTGLDVVEWIGTNKPELPVAVITAHGNMETAVQALKLGAFDFVSKPVNLGMLRKLINTALKLESVTAQAPNDDLPHGKLLGQSTAMVRVREMITKVARSPAPVHIRGESGTGKELVARSVHDSGPRAQSPFVAINCGAIPGELMESELFGHKKGSFTGAVDDKLGVIRSAEGGTLFLDEVADLPLHMQVKLLRVIQEKSVRPVGESAEQPVDVRILSATHKNLGQLVHDGKFREDLYYRINVIELSVPPLRERDNDITLLTDFVLKKLSKQMDKPGLALAQDAREKLKTYGYPGNVRELENILERAATLCNDEIISMSDLLLRAGETDDIEADNLRDKLGDVERQAIIDALVQTRNNKTKAAELLGMSFRQLRYRIKKLDIDS